MVLEEGTPITGRKGDNVTPSGPRDATSDPQLLTIALHIGGTPTDAQTWGLRAEPQIAITSYPL
jgi:hypothetical protein